MSTQIDDEELPQPRAFVAVKRDEDTWVMDLPTNTEVKIGDQDGIQLHTDKVENLASTLKWDGNRLVLKVMPGKHPTFLNGKKCSGSTELKPGDEVAVAGGQLVVGIAVPPSSGGRRAFTHHEFRERLYEEMARAQRGRRPTSLVMVQARTGDGGRVSNTALDSFRAGDVVGTYAHDEVEFLLPDTDFETARTVVKRILKESGAVGAVAGIATAPEHGENPERLVREARAALDVARKGGGDVAPPPPRSKTISSPEVHDEATKDLVNRLRQIANEKTVLLTGEASSGKAMFARLMHDESSGPNDPFEVVACASFDPEDADVAAIEKQVLAAKGGTLVLDEVGELPANGQQAVLKGLEQVGDDIRIVTTTDRALAGLVDRGAFLPELHKKLAGEVAEVPALRSRPDDIIPLAERFAIAVGAAEPVQLSPGALARLRSHPWPGNVLELRNAMERAVRLAGHGEILAEHLPSDALTIGSGDGRLREHVDSVERDAIIKALADSNHNQTHAAKRLGISRRALIYKMEKYGLKPPPGTARKN